MVLDSHYARKICNVTDRWSAAGLEFEISAGPGAAYVPEKDRQVLKKLDDWQNMKFGLLMTREGKICFTSLRDGTVYAIYPADEDETEPPANVWLTAFTPQNGSKLQLLGSSIPLAWERIEKGVLIHIPEAVRKTASGKYAWTIKIAG